MEIKQHWYYILKNSNDINDVVQVLEVYPGQIVFKYYTDVPLLTVNSQPLYQRDTKRVLHPKAFRACYKEHPTLNVLYSI